MFGRSKNPRRVEHANWTRDMKLSSGRVARLVIADDSLTRAVKGWTAVTPVVQVHGDIHEGEAWEIRDRLKQDPFVSRAPVKETL